ncbi:MAG: amidohydrolase family protein [Coriobacteriia bacterium]|nr:amidohydrolase family protein [Coriobacteriia bacterium]
MIVGADWLITGVGAPTRRGGVYCHASQVVEVGTFDDLVAAHPAQPAEYFADCIITPGLVNAHTHLSLTVLQGLTPRGEFAPWLGTVTRAVLAMGHDDFAASASLGAIESLQCGVTAVGDIVYGPEALAATADAGVAGAFFWEVLGIDAADLSGELADSEFPTGRGSCTTGRTRCGISPHAPYSSGPQLLQATHTIAAAHGVGYAVHVAESLAESELTRHGAGPFAPIARRLAPDFTTPRRSPVAYLDSLGVLDDALAIHCVQVDADDIRLLKQKTRGVALCPRSNEYLGNGHPPVSELYAAGVTIALGTDSAASNADLDLMNEVRAIRRLGPAITSRRLLRMVTTDGARALGLGDTLGSLEPGKQADVAVFRIAATADPETAVVKKAGRDTLAAVITAGSWRVRDSRPCFPTGAADRAGARAREVAQRAIDAV